MFDGTSIEAKLVSEVFEDVRKKDIASAFRGCQRLALKSGDLVNFAYFLYEQEHGDQEAFRHLCKSLGDLDREQIKLLHKQAVDRKLRNRAFDKKTCEILGVEEGTVFWVGCAQIDIEIEASQEKVDALQVPNNINDIDAAFFYKENEMPKLHEIFRRSSIKAIKERLLSAAFDYASLMEQKLDWGQNDKIAISEIENSIFSFLEELSPASLTQLQGAASLLNSTDPEKRSQASLLIRRCLTTIADAVQEPIPSIKGLDQDKPLNRISYYLETTSTGNQKTLCAFKHKDLESLLRSINEKSSKGVHKEVSSFELQQVYLATILYLGNIAKAHELKILSP